MNNPAVRAWGAAKRERNIIAKQLRSDPQYRMQVRANKKLREAQRKYRKAQKDDGDYENLDDWLTHTENF